MVEKSEVVQVRLPHGLLKKMDEKIKDGIFSSRQDFIKHIIRKNSI